MKVYLDPSNITQNMHGASINYWYVLDVSGVCFEERYKEVYDGRAYHAKGLDVPANVDANSRSEKKAMHGTGEASKYEEVEVSTFEYSH